MAEKDDIRVPLPDGRVAVFPAGTRPEVIKAAVEAYKAPASAEAPTPSAGAAESPGELPRPPAEAISAPGTGRPPGAKPGALADTFLGRAVRGALVNRVDPLAEAAARGANAIGLAPPSSVTDVQGINRDRKTAYEASRAAAGDTGFDQAGTLGTAAFDMALLGRLGLPRTLVGMTGYGAIGGGLGGMMTPVEDSDQMSNLGYLGQLLKQGAVGAAVGAVAAPAAAVSLDKLATGAKSVGQTASNFVRRMVNPTLPQRLASNASDLDALLEAQARQVGVDWPRVPNAVKESLREAARRATNSTGDFPRDAVKNRLIAEREGLPQLTLGQATRDPMQYSREANSPDETLRALFGEQRNAATDRLHIMANRFGPDRTPYELGSRIGAEIESQAKTRRAAVGKLYDAFTDDAAGYHKIQNTPDFVRNALTALKTEQSFDDLPPVFQKQLLDLEAAGDRLSIRDAAQLWKNINKFHSTTAGTPAGNALGTVKAELGKLLDNPTFSVTSKGDDVIAKFRAANAERRALGEWENSSRAIADLASRDPRVAAEKVFERFVMSGSVDDMSGLWKTLPLELRNEVKREFVNRVSTTALNDYKSQATKAGAATKLLENFPKEKLALMFKDEELRSLRNTLEYLRLTSEAPPGNFVNRSNSLVDLKDFVASTSNVPLTGAAVSRPLRALMEQHMASKATSGGLATRPQVTSPDFLKPIERRIPYVPAAVGAGLVNAEQEYASPEE